MYLAIRERESIYGSYNSVYKYIYEYDLQLINSSYVEYKTRDFLNVVNFFVTWIWRSNSRPVDKEQSDSRYKRIIRVVD